MDGKPHTGASASRHDGEPSHDRSVPAGHPEAIVHPVAAAQRIRVERVAPRTELAGFVDYFWIVRWDTDEPYEQQVVTQPRVHVAAEHGRLLVHGLNREPFSRRLVGRGHTIGAAFRAGGFRPMLLGTARIAGGAAGGGATGAAAGTPAEAMISVGSLSGRVVPASEVLGFDDAVVASAVGATEDTTRMVTVFEEALLGCEARRDPLAERLDELVGYAERTPSLTRAEDLAVVAGVSLRTLQRQFTEVVGIGPKWVIQRFRLLDVAAAIVGARSAAGTASAPGASGTSGTSGTSGAADSPGALGALGPSSADIDWADLAVTLGFSDQSHLIRVFASVVGTPPARYAGDPATRSHPLTR